MTIHQENTPQVEASTAQSTPIQQMAPPQAASGLHTAHTPAQSQNKPDGIGSLLVDILVMAFVAALVTLAVQYFSPDVFDAKGTAGEAQIVTVNFEQLTKEQIIALGTRVSEGSVPVDEMTERSSKFTEALLGKINSYANEGKVVLRGDAVLAAPESVLDITAKLRDELQAQGLMERPVQSKK